MNQPNLEYLKNSLKYLGFGEELNEELERNIESEFPDFRMSYETHFRRDKIIATLEFRRSDTTDIYFFNRYSATIGKEGREKSQTFYINRGSGVTLKEAYNLLSGRSVHKDLTNSRGEAYSAWLKLDLDTREENGNHRVRQFHSNYGFDLGSELNQLPLKGLQEPDLLESIIGSLQKGNLHPISAIFDGKEEKLFLEANPQFKTINIYDSALKIIPKEERKKLGVARAESKDQEPKKNKKTETMPGSES